MSSSTKGKIPSADPRSHEIEQKLDQLVADSLEAPEVRRAAFDALAKSISAHRETQALLDSIDGSLLSVSTLINELALSEASLRSIEEHGNSLPSNRGDSIIRVRETIEDSVRALQSQKEQLCHIRAELTQMVESKEQVQEGIVLALAHRGATVSSQQRVIDTLLAEQQDALFTLSHQGKLITELRKADEQRTLRFQVRRAQAGVRLLARRIVPLQARLGLRWVLRRVGLRSTRW